MAAPRQRRTATASKAEVPPSDIARRRMERRAASGRRSDARWEEVLAGAARVFARLGYGRSTLEDVAGEVGIRRATLYYYVGTKEELLVALLHDPIVLMRTRLEEVAAQPVSAPERLERALREYVRTMAELPELFIFMGENVHQVMSGPDADDIRANADRYGRVLAQVIQSGAEAGEFRTDIDPSVAVMGIIGMFNWMHRWYNPDGPRRLEEFGDVFIEMALSSLAPR